jgi:hypothetical protein
MNAAQLFAAATPRERRDAFQREAEEQLETARAIAGQYPPKVADVERARKHIAKALRALQELEAQIRLMDDANAPFVTALRRRGGW